MPFPLTPKFPAGVKYFKAVLNAVDTAGEPISGTWTVEPETPLVYGGTIVVAQTTTRAFEKGRCEFFLPFTDQAGFTSGITGDAIIDFGYRFLYKPRRASMMSTETYVQVPAATVGGVLGAEVQIASLTNIGSWPHATVTVGSGVDPLAGDWVEISPGMWQLVTGGSTPSTDVAALHLFVGGW